MLQLPLPYVFSRTNNTSSDWIQQAYIKASNTGGGDRFGYSVSLDASGDTLAVGARLEDSYATGVGNQTRWSAMDSYGSRDSGAVYLFTHNASNGWIQQAYIKASNTGVEDYFGISVSLSADGTTLAVGANQEDSNATGIGGDQSNDDVYHAGAVYLY